MDVVRLLTEVEAGEIANVSRWTIRRRIEAGHLPAVNYGSGSRKLYRIRLDDLMRVQPAEPPPPRERRRRKAAVVTASSGKAWPPAAA